MEAPDGQGIPKGAGDGGRHPLLSKPLYVFGLPTDVLQTVSLRSIDVPVALPSSSSNSASQAALGDGARLEKEDVVPSPAAVSAALELPSEGIQKPLPSGRYTCNVCADASFQDLDEQRAHFRTDWHRYNLNLKIGRSKGGKSARDGSKPVTEEEFERLVEGLEDSLSGSASDSSDASTSSRDAVSTLLSRTSLSRRKDDGNVSDEEEESSRLRAHARSPLLWFTSTFLPQTQLGVYRALLDEESGNAALSKDEYARLLLRLQYPPLEKPGRARWGGRTLKGVDAGALGMRVVDGEGMMQSSDGSDSPSEDGNRDDSKMDRLDETAAMRSMRCWTLIMMGGGHFAGMVIGLMPRVSGGGTNKKGKAKQEDKELVVLRHKTFHRYTTRRKQGGAQSALDAAKGPAKSAGANLRRYNEQALADEVRELLEDWRELVGRSERVFIRAGSSNRKALFNYEDAVIDKKDPRIRGFPFPTRRPTLNELMRCFIELTRVKVTHLSEEELRALDDEYLASIAPKSKPVQPSAAPPPKPIMPAAARLSKEEEARRERFRRLLDMVRKGRLDAMVAFLEKHEQELLGEDAEGGLEVNPTIDRRLPEWLREEEAADVGNLLQLAVSVDQPEVVRYLLVERRADPTVTVPTRGDGAGSHRTAYDLAKSKETRNVFRRLMAEHPDWYDWAGMGPGGARVPSALTSEMEESKGTKEKERKKTLREKMKERERERAAKTPPPPPERTPEALPPQPEVASPLAGPRRLGGGPKSAMGSAAVDTAAGVTPEMRMRIEREKRARAAEARMKALGQR